jgi:hypothetical protein
MRERAYEELRGSGIEKEYLMKEKPCCIVCGKKRGLKRVVLEHGMFHLCNRGHCITALLWESEKSLPLVWAGPNELLSHELITEEECSEMEQMSAEDYTFIRDKMADYLWECYGDMFGNMFNEVLEQGVRSNEALLIKHTPKKDLPLLIGHIKDKENQQYLEERIKNE